MWHWSFNRRRLYLFAGEMRKIQWNPPKKDREFIVTMKNNSILPQNYKIMICCSLAIIGGKRIIYNSILAHHKTSIDRVREKNCITMELWVLELQCKRIGFFFGKSPSLKLVAIHIHDFVPERLFGTNVRFTCTQFME